MPFILDFASDQEAEEYSSFILRKAVRGGEVLEEFISKEDFKQVIDSWDAAVAFSIRETRVQYPINGCHLPQVK